jgi:hypothetical protein
MAGLSYYLVFLHFRRVMTSVSGWLDRAPTSPPPERPASRQADQMTTTDELMAPAPTALVSSVLADRHRIPLEAMPAEAGLRETVDRFLPRAEIQQVPVAAFNSSI